MESLLEHSEGYVNVLTSDFIKCELAEHMTIYSHTHTPDKHKEEEPRNLY